MTRTALLFGLVLLSFQPLAGAQEPVEPPPPPPEVPPVPPTPPPPPPADLGDTPGVDREDDDDDDDDDRRAVGKGSWELRLQTQQAFFRSLVSQLVGGGAPGVSYESDSELLTVSLSGGAGYLVKDNISIGGDVNFTYISPGEGDSLFILVLDPFVRFVAPAVISPHTGLFVETGPGIGINFGGAAEDDSNILFNVDLFGGAHIFITDRVALLAGGFFEYLKILDPPEGQGDTDTVLLGLRLGMSVYTAPN